MDNFDAALDSWIAGAQAIVSDYQRKHYPNNPETTLKAPGRWTAKRYIRVVATDTPMSGSAFAFIDTTNGDVLKPASWKAPAKHARGNIFDDHNGLASMGPYGPAYLR